MIEFQLIDDTEDVEVNLVDNSENIEIELIKEIDSYNQLKDKPSINNVTLTGNKTLHELGIQPEGDYAINSEVNAKLAQKVDKVSGKGLSTNDYTTPEKNKLASLENYDDTEIRQLIDAKQPRGNYALKSEIPTKNSQLQNDSGFISQETDPTVPNHVKTITQNNITNWNNKQEQLISGTNIKTINNTSILGSGNIEIESGGSDYSNLTNKPKINNVELKGNKTSSDLGLQPAGDYVTNTDYGSFDTAGVIKASSTYGTQFASTGAMYAQTKTYEQYTNSTSSGLFIGKGTLENVITGKGLVTSTDLASKQNITDNTLTTTNKTIPTAINEVNSIAKGANQAVSYNNYSTMITTLNSLAGDVYNIGQNIYIQTLEVPDLWISDVFEESTIYTYVDDETIVNELKQYGYIEVGYYAISMLETQKVDLTNYVTNTDYASGATAGVVKSSANYGTQVAASGIFYGSTRTYEQYQDGNSNVMICKGTLENVITGKGLITNTTYPDDGESGVIKVGASYGTAAASSGHLIASVKTYEDYSSAGNYLLVGKGTLENVITGKNLATKNDIPKVFYGTSATGATTAAKVVVCGDFTEADLVAGTRITVLFTNANTYNGQATLNINGTGAKNIYYNGTTTNARYMWVAGESVEFIYNGEQWATINGGLASTTYYGVTKLATGANSDSQSYALTPRSLYYFANYSICPYYSASSTYAVGDKVRYTYYIYECITAIETPEAWTAAHWQQVDTLQEQIDTKVSNTDYATPSVGGVIMVKNGDHGITVDEGVLKGTVRTYAQYNDMSSKGIVCKGTLENVITGKGINPTVTLTQAEYDALVSGGTVDSNTYYFIT